MYQYPEIHLANREILELKKSLTIAVNIIEQSEHRIEILKDTIEIQKASIQQLSSLLDNVENVFQIQVDKQRELKEQAQAQLRLVEKNVSLK